MALPTASDNPFPSLLIVEGTEPSAPSAGRQRLYIDSTSHKLKRTDSSGTDVTVEGATDPTSSRGEIIRRGAAALEALQAKTLGKVLVGDGTDVVSAYPPGYEFDYAQITSTITITGTAEGSETTVITGNSVAYDGSTAVNIQFHSGQVIVGNTAADIIVIVLYEDSTFLGRIATVQTPAASAIRVPVTTILRRTPSNASHTYTVKAYKTASAATSVGADTGGTGKLVAAHLRITKV